MEKENIIKEAGKLIEAYHAKLLLHNLGGSGKRINEDGTMYQKFAQIAIQKYIENNATV